MKPCLKAPNPFYIEWSNYERLNWDKKFYHKSIFKSLSQYYYYRQREQHKTEGIIFLYSSSQVMIALNFYKKLKKYLERWVLKFLQTTSTISTYSYNFDLSHANKQLKNSQNQHSSVPN